jgi:hypothetical protein
MAFSSGKIVVTVLIINFLCLFAGIGLENSSIINYFFTMTGTGDFSTYDGNSPNIAYGTDNNKIVDSDVQDTIDTAKNNLEDVSVNTTGYIGGFLDTIKLILGLFLLMITFAAGGLIIFAISAGMPVFFWLILAPVQVMYIMSIIDLFKGGST